MSTIFPGKFCFYPPSSIIMISKDDYSTFGSVWPHVRVAFYCEASHRGGGPGGVLGSKLFVILDRYIIPCFYPAESVILIFLAVQSCVVVG